MKEVKFLLNVLFWAIYTSSWWVASRWSNELDGFFWFISTLLTVFVVIFFIVYIGNNWRK